MAATRLIDGAGLIMEPTTVTLITGASSGSGREIAIHLSRSRRLILHGRDAARLAETRDRCERPESQILWIQDLRDTAAIAAPLTALIESRPLAVEGFVHSAGLLKIAPLRLIEPGEAAGLMAVNCLSAAEITRVLIAKKTNARHLKGIVFISSTASQFGAKGFNVYCASKGALDALMRALAVELAPGVRVNSVLPGAVRTPMTESMLADAELRERMQAGYPLGLGESKDIATAVEYLLSDGARWITGHSLVVDGGRTVNITG